MAKKRDFQMKKIFIYVIIFLCATSLSAEKYAGEFLNLGVGVKATSMGNAFVSVANDPTAVFWNPAGMQSSQNLSFDIMHSEEFAGNLKYDTFAFTYPFESNLHFGFLLTRIGISGIPLTALENPDSTISEENPPYAYKYVSDADYTGYLAFSSEISPKISWGVSSKIIYKNIGDISASGLGLDIGFLFHANENIRLGANLRDAFGTTIWWDDGLRERINPNIFAGTGMDFLFPILFKPATLSLQSDILFEGRKSADQLHYKKTSADFHLGLKIDLADFLSICGGIDRTNPSAGVEIAYQRFHLNYAFHSHNKLSSSHRISLGARF
jgi:hypothetical protein